MTDIKAKDYLTKVKEDWEQRFGVVHDALCADNAIPGNYFWHQLRKMSAGPEHGYFYRIISKDGDGITVIREDGTIEVLEIMYNFLDYKVEIEDTNLTEEEWRILCIQ
jgi:hypothetical protein